ncbi:globin-coupled sensor protein [Ammoniphilus sp. CFH 90114]|uniref:globin-coupled sensor protein n=1 Tax=Ammoniphilus sp. CFH 90114 TaxID=2493665 RepID=UPI00100F2A28|nr:globin-coupled sensor protein [Ammoniphilus sp. CFH 90114]RXT02883.1 globin-coupled sensor protein [Ammoniphilus sp. CFH 90114]
MSKCPFSMAFTFLGIARKKPKMDSLLEQSKRIHGKMVIDDREISRQLDIISLSEEDLKLVKLIQPLIIQKMDDIVQQFYGNITKQSNLLAIITRHSTVERLQGTLKTHIQELFNGEIDEEFVKKRIRIAHAHVKVGLETKWYMCAFQDLFSSIVAILDKHIENRTDLIGAIMVCSKLLNFEQQLVLEAYEQEHQRIRQVQEETKQKVNTAVQQAVESLAAVSEETSASVQELSAQTDHIMHFAKRGSNLAIASEERSIKGKGLVENQQESMDSIRDRMNKILQDSEDLQNVSKKIQDIVGMITSIADQTNLLALNAAIEAARAGEYGKGFSVVAGEIRKLADQTKQSISGVSALVAQTDTQVSHVSQSVQSIHSLIESGNQYVSQTVECFDEILEAMCQTKEQNQAIEKELEMFVKTLAEISEASSEIAYSTDSLNQTTNELM